MKKDKKIKIVEVAVDMDPKLIKDLAKAARKLPDRVLASLMGTHIFSFVTKKDLKDFFAKRKAHEKRT